MCGIAGYSGSFEPSLLQQFNSIQAHRGPDDSGTWFDQTEGIGLAHTRLSIIDLSETGHQPMKSSCSNYIITFNGEIYNYRELKKELEGEGSTFRSTSDTEVVLILYQKYGKELLHKLNGIFAFAIWDQHKKELFVARDQIGIKPLYYCNPAEGFVFASEIKTILQHEDIDRSIDIHAVHDYSTYLWCPAPRTMLKAVKKLEPGSAMVVQKGKVVRKWQYYDLPYHQDLRAISEAEAVEELQLKLNECVERQMVSDVPVGAFLSGGLDSSTVVSFAKQHQSHSQFQCFTIDTQSNSEGFADDLPYARTVADFLGVTLNVIKVGPEIVDQLEHSIWHLDEPQADPAPLNVLFISKLARENGIKVLLSGSGGDDIFTGYRRHYALLQEKYWNWLPPIARKALQFSSSAIPEGNALGRRLSKAFRFADMNSVDRLTGYFHWLSRTNQHSLFSKGVVESLNDRPFSAPLKESLEAISEKTHPLNKMLYLEGKHFLADHNLNYTDKMSMACGVEVRVPLLDTELIKFAAALPINHKQRGKAGKWIFKKAMESYLPKSVIYRPKTGFGAPIRCWLQRELKPLVEDILSFDSLKKRGLFNPNGVHKLIKMDRKGLVDASYTIFSLVCTELWCQLFIDRRNYMENS